MYKQKYKSLRLQQEIDLALVKAELVKKIFCSCTVGGCCAAGACNCTKNGAKSCTSRCGCRGDSAICNNDATPGVLAKKASRKGKGGNGHRLSKHDLDQIKKRVENDLDLEEEDEQEHRMQDIDAKK